VYLLLEKALVGWVTILLELAVGVVLMGVKLYLDLRPRWDLGPAQAARLMSSCGSLHATGKWHTNHEPASVLCMV